MGNAYVEGSLKVYPPLLEQERDLLRDMWKGKKSVDLDMIKECLPEDEGEALGRMEFTLFPSSDGERLFAPDGYCSAYNLSVELVILVRMFEKGSLAVRGLDWVNEHRFEGTISVDDDTDYYQLEVADGKVFTTMFELRPAWKIESKVKVGEYGNGKNRFEHVDGEYVFGGEEE